VKSGLSVGSIPHDPVSPAGDKDIRRYTGGFGEAVPKGGLRIRDEPGECTLTTDAESLRHDSSPGIPI
jgi:hypothetical protein